MKTKIAVGLLMGLLAGCATPSDDPHKGGLFGYMAHGSSGYQKRLDQKQQDLSGIEQNTTTVKAEAGQLEAEKQEKAAALEKQKAELAQLDKDLGAIENDVGTLQAQSEEQEDRKAELELEINRIKADLQLLGGDTSAAVQERDQKIEALKKEIKALHKKASLRLAL